MRSQKLSVLTGLLGLALLLCITAFATREAWLKQMGRMLVRQDAPFQADVVSVLGGDWYGNRILKAGELVRKGYAPVALVSGGGYLYGKYEAELAIQFAVTHGYEAKLFRKLEYPCVSTADEAQAVVREMRRMNVKRYILVTSLFHTARAGRIFASAAPDLELRVLPSEDTLQWDHWWTTREARKVFLLEFTKSLTSRFGV